MTSASSLCSITRPTCCAGKPAESRQKSAMVRSINYDSHWPGCNKAFRVLEREGEEGEGAGKMG